MSVASTKVPARIIRPRAARSALMAHISADRDSQLVHTVVIIAANVADIMKTAALLHGQETQVHADAGYTGVEKRAGITALDRRIDCRSPAQTRSAL